MLESKAWVVVLVVDAKFESFCLASVCCLGLTFLHPHEVPVDASSYFDVVSLYSFGSESTQIELFSRLFDTFLYFRIK